MVTLEIVTWIPYFRAVKNAIKALLQGVLGYRNYLRYFSWFKVKTLHRDSREDDFFAFLAKLPEDGTVLDIGANLGFLTVHLAQKVKNGQVISFEPMPDNLDALNYVVKKFKLNNVRVEACALGESDGEVEMVLPVQGNARQQGLSHIVHEELKEHNDGIKFKVPLKKLDSIDYLFQTGVKVTGIKMDVENFEQFVLRGAEKLLRQHQPMVFLELWDNANRTFCFDFLQKLGYETYVVENGKHVRYASSIHVNSINFLMIRSIS